MDQAYFIDRMRASLTMARAATESAARLIDLELAGRYSLAAATDCAEPGCWQRALAHGGSSFHNGAR